MISVPRYYIAWQHMYTPDYGHGEPLFHSKEEAWDFITLLKAEEDPEGVRVYTVEGPVFVNVQE